MSNEPIDLDAAQALTDAATPGPWTFNGSEFRAPSPYNGFMLVRAVCKDSDAEFIAQARTLVPALFAELLEARDALARVRDVEAKARYAERMNIERGDELVKLRMELKVARATIARVKALRDRYVDGEKAERERAARAFLPSSGTKHQESAQQCYWAHDSLTAALEGRDS